jgi:ADP-ribose pyrophosphatase YjhB (NUDIX family)
MRHQLHCGVYALLHTRQHLLLVYKKRGPYKGLWDLPGGRQESGESLLETLNRELQEEIGASFQKAEFLGKKMLEKNYLSAEGPLKLHHTAYLFSALLENSRFSLSQPFSIDSSEDTSKAEWKHIYDDFHQFSPLAQIACRSLFHPPRSAEAPDITRTP